MEIVFVTSNKEKIQIAKNETKNTNIKARKRTIND